jgi:RNA 3'-terminal phosphate cyclase
MFIVLTDHTTSSTSIFSTESEFDAMFIGITNDTKDPSVDTFRMVTLHMLKHFGVPLEGLELKIESRGAPPLGGGEVLLRVPNINSTLTVCWSLLLLTFRDLC